MNSSRLTNLAVDVLMAILSQLNTIQRDTALIGIVKSLDKRDDRRFPSSWRAHESQRLAGSDFEWEVLKCSANAKWYVPQVTSNTVLVGREGYENEIFSSFSSPWKLVLLSKGLLEIVNYSCLYGLIDRSLIAHLWPAHKELAEFSGLTQCSRHLGNRVGDALQCIHYHF